MAFLRLIRFKNLILLFLALFLTHFYYTKYEDISLNFNITSFFLLILSILLIASAGNVINDLLDTETDKINKPKKIIINKFISYKKGLKIYFLLNLTSLIFASYLSFKIGNLKLLFIFIVTIFLLYLYSKILKGKPLLGNLLIALLTPAPILILPYFDLPESHIKTTVLNTICIIYIFGFLLNLIREIIKDIEDYKGDKQQKINTFSVKYGTEKSIFLVRVLIVFTMILLQISIVYLFKINPFLASYLFVFIQTPLLYIFLQITEKNTKKMSFILKIILLFGVFSMLLIN